MVIRSIPIAILRAKASFYAPQKPFSWRRERDLNPQMVSHVGFRDRDATDYVLSLRFFGCRTWNRTTRVFWTADLQSALAPYEITRHPSWLRRRDLNPRPSAYEADELPDCSTAQFVVRRTHPRLPATRSDRIGLEPISPDGWNCITIWRSMSTWCLTVLLYVYVLVYFLQS